MGFDVSKTAEILYANLAGVISDSVVVGCGGNGDVMEVAAAATAVLGLHWVPKVGCLAGFEDFAADFLAPDEFLPLASADGAAATDSPLSKPLLWLMVQQLLQPLTSPVTSL